MKKEKDIVLTEQTFYILLALCNPLHGYGVMQKVEVITDGRIKLGAGTLYGAFVNLQKSKLIDFVGIDEENSRRKIFIITSKGRCVLSQEVLRMEENVKVAKEILFSEEGK